MKKPFIFVQGKFQKNISTLQVELFLGRLGMQCTSTFSNILNVPSMSPKTLFTNLDFVNHISSASRMAFLRFSETSKKKIKIFKKVFARTESITLIAAYLNLGSQSQNSTHEKKSGKHNFWSKNKKKLYFNLQKIY